MDFRLCNIRFLATLFAFNKNKMSLPVACYFEQKRCCFGSMLVGGTLVKMVLSTHSLLMALGEILICFLAISPATGKQSNPGHGLCQTANTATLLFFSPCHSCNLEAYCVTRVIKVQVSRKSYSRTKFQQENTVIQTLCTSLEMPLVSS